MALQNLSETEQAAPLPAEALAHAEVQTEDSPHAKLSGRLISAASLTGIGSVITMALGLFGSIAIARNSGPAGYAVYVIANMLVFVPAVICSCGIPLALSRHVASEEEHGNHEALRRLTTTMLLLMVALALLTGTGLGLNLSYFEHWLGVSLGQSFAAMLPLLLVCAVFADGVQGIYFGLLRTRQAIIISLAAPLATILYVLVRRAGAPLPIWGAVAAFYFGSALVAAYKVWRDRLLGRPSSLAKIAPVFRDLLPTAVFTLFMTFTVWSDRWVAGTYLGAVAIGSYSAAVVIIQAVLRVPKNMIVMLVPATARVATSGAERSASFNRAIISHFGLFAALISVVLMLAPGMIVQTIFGPGFSFAAPALLLMTPSVLASAISIPLISVLTGSTRNRLVTYLLIFTTVPRIILLLIFTRLWSLMGTALATMLSDFLLALCCIVLSRVANLSFPLRPLLRPFLLGVIAYSVGLGALFLGLPHPVAIILALLVFSFDIWRVTHSILLQNR
ncbi:MAG TPA: oligosaccharide flippase family protein [Pyrinomonadaceae bacterium]|jgi:stage V sporulation protein B